MSGATGAGTSAGTGKNGGGRGSAASAGDARTTDARGAGGAGGAEGRAADTHTTQLKAIKAPVADSPSTGPQPPKGPSGSSGARAAQTSQAGSTGPQGTQGGTVTDTRGAQGKQEASPLPGERQPQQPAGPYHPPQAYPTQAPPAADAVRRPRTGARTTPRVRKARLRVAKADPWSVMKVSFLLSIALGICTIVAAAMLWMVMDAMGVFSTVGGTISEATGSNESNGFDLQSFLSLPHVLMFTSIIAVIDVVLATALATLGAFIYNLSAGFVGGVELTLAEDE
ncbi:MULTISPECIES: DUF3566 domain-containing protein [unclassified Streptomyces]|uniref:DUF3566 domain-containing protein n=1 Tax=unclassified Streptomyces TaxID=2593676 RepID=UPI0029A460E0|nr:DUF3566 domain-containing protein [Streptomyces sp. FL07-04A]MDX3576471.1 DUF3566 domain-containing protein [Streptomyces sp. FL07-04A]